MGAGSLALSDADRARLNFTRIEPPRKLGSLDLGELWRYRELFYFLIWRDLKVRYKQTVFGALWAIVQPMILAIIFTLVFHRLGRVPTSGTLPYPVFVYSGLLIYSVFSQGLVGASTSLVVNTHLINKVYFPRLVLPFASAASFFADLAFSLPVLAGLVLINHVDVRPTVVFAPAFLLLALSAAIAIGVWLAAANARYRDVRYASTILTQLLMYGSPILYPLAEVPEHWRLIYSINPIAGVVEGFRWAVFGTTIEILPVVLMSVLSVSIVSITGLVYFLRSEQTIVDVI